MERASIRQLVEGRAWLFADDSYHIDVSHLAAVVRMSTIVEDSEGTPLLFDAETGNMYAITLEEL